MSMIFTGTLPVNKEYFTGTIPVIKKYLKRVVRTQSKVTLEVT